MANKGFQLEEKMGVRYYIIPAFEEKGSVIHGFSTRYGGVSSEPFDSLNLGFHTGDDYHAVLANRYRFCQALGFSPEKLVAGKQVHKDNIQNVDFLDIGKGALDQDSAIPETDALITNKPGIGLIAFFADCVPLMFLDPVKKVIGIAHAGWKGTVLRIGQKTVAKMKEVYGCQPKNILAAIGPSIGPCHYEVDKPVIEQFQKQFSNWAQFMKVKSNGKAQLNLWEANRLQLLEAGISDVKITVAEICTYCNPELLFSYRYSEGKTGRIAALIMLVD
ncbi:MAG: peptidoglycan editing factor PgeF [Clostridia bacterium]|nr:peptidoglycan editing factor PgeF [Clostridia bacterium]